MEAVRQLTDAALAAEFQRTQSDWVAAGRPTNRVIINKRTYPLFDVQLRNIRLLKLKEQAWRELAADFHERLSKGEIVAVTLDGLAVPKERPLRVPTALWSGLRVREWTASSASDGYHKVTKLRFWSNNDWNRTAMIPRSTRAGGQMKDRDAASSSLDGLAVSEAIAKFVNAHGLQEHEQLSASRADETRAAMLLQDMIADLLEQCAVGDLVMTAFVGSDAPWQKRVAVPPAVARWLEVDLAAGVAKRGSTVLEGVRFHQPEELPPDLRLQWHLSIQAEALVRTERSAQPKQRTSGRPDSKVRSLSAATIPPPTAPEACRQWLIAMRHYAPLKPKDGYWLQAQRLFHGLSRRAFDREWAVTVGNDPRWSRGGRRKWLK